MSQFRTLVEDEINQHFNSKRKRYYITYSTWGGPEGDDKEVHEFNAGNDLNQAIEICWETSVELNKLVDVYEEFEDGSFNFVKRFVNGEERDIHNQSVRSQAIKYYVASFHTPYNYNYLGKTYPMRITDKGLESCEFRDATKFDSEEEAQQAIENSNSFYKSKLTVRKYYEL